MAEPSPSKPAEAGILIARLFDAARERVWKEWTEPERFGDWFGGGDADVPVTTISMDVREGGAWRATMFAGPDRHEMKFRGQYREVVEPKLLVLTLSDRPQEVYELVTVVLSDLGNGWTEMLFRQRGHLSPEQYERARTGWGSFFDRMAESLRDD